MFCYYLTWFCLEYKSALTYTRSAINQAEWDARHNPTKSHSSGQQNSCFIADLFSYWYEGSGVVQHREFVYCRDSQRIQWYQSISGRELRVLRKLGMEFIIGPTIFFIQEKTRRIGKEFGKRSRPEVVRYVDNNLSFDWFNFFCNIEFVFFSLPLVLSQASWCSFRHWPDLISSGNGWLIQTLNQFQIFVMIRKSAVQFGEFIVRVLSTVTVSTAEPSVLNPLARLMKTILMFPAQVHYYLCHGTSLWCNTHLCRTDSDRSFSETPVTKINRS